VPKKFFSTMKMLCILLDETDCKWEDPKHMQKYERAEVI
jgi:hypothetical protein